MDSPPSAALLSPPSSLLPILRLLLSVSPLAPSLLQCSQNSLAQQRPPSTVGRFGDFGVYLGDAGHGLKVLCAAKLEQHARARRGGRGRRDSVNSRSPRDRGECAHASHLPHNSRIPACNCSPHTTSRGSRSFTTRSRDPGRLRAGRKMLCPSETRASSPVLHVWLHLRVRDQLRLRLSCFPP